MRMLEKAGRPDYTVAVADSVKEFATVTSLCERGKRATAVRMTLLLVLPTGHTLR
jgi:hypothetical protein